MPKFYSIDEFREWDQAARLRGITDSGNGGRGVVSGEREGAEVFPVSWKEFDIEGEDYLETTLRRCEAVTHMAYGLLNRAVDAGDISATFGAVKNWTASLKETAVVRDDFLQLQKDERAVIALDEVKHVVGMVIQEIVAQMEAAAPKAAKKANPAEPKLAFNAFQTALDEVRMGVVSSLTRIESELGVYPEDEAEGLVCES